MTDNPNYEEVRKVHHLKGTYVQLPILAEVCSLISNPFNFTRISLGQKKLQGYSCYSTASYTLAYKITFLYLESCSDI